MIVVAEKLKPANDLLAPVTIGRSGAAEAAAWDAYVEQHQEGSFFHLYGWGDIIEAAYGYEPVFLIARRGNRVVGVLPLVDVKAPLLGRSLISTAFTVGGGPIGDDLDVISALADAAASEGAARNVKYVELRSENAVLDNWQIKADIYATFRMTMPPHADDHLNGLRRSRRRAIRKAVAAKQSGVLKEWVEMDASRFYDVYARSLRNHGTPVFPKRFLAHLLQVFERRVEISFTEVNGEIAGALLSFYFKDAVMPYYFGAMAAGREVNAHEYQYWALMRRAASDGYKTFDFGRSKIGTGPYRFKELWDAKPTPLYYQYKLIAGDEQPNVNPNNPKFATFVKLWRRLPVPVVNIAGPLLARNFP